MATLTAVRPSARWRLRHIDTRLAVGLGLVAVSVIVGLRISATHEHSTPVYAATRRLSVGHVVTADDLRMIPLAAGDDVVKNLVRSSDPDVIGRVVQNDVATGALLPLTAVGDRPAKGRELTVAVTADHALGGRLHPGDRVDVLASFEKNTDAAKTMTVTSGAQVLDVLHSDGLFGQEQGGLSGVTLSVKPGDAVFLAFAMRNGEIDIVRSLGAQDDRAAGDRFDATDLP
jgi:Flp pilus assembly protein CpaB